MDLFLDNKYARAYWALVDSRKNKKAEGYTETHHIIPRCLGGTDDESNLIRLSAREHFIAHLLLVKAVKDPDARSKMAFALTRLVHGNSKNYTNNSRTYQYIQELNSKASSQRSKRWWSQFTQEERSQMRSGKNNGRYGVEVKQSTRDKIGNANKGKQPRLGISHTEESKKKMSENRKGIGVGSFWCHNPETQEEKVLHSLPDGWIKGRTPKKVKPSYGALGKKWFHNPETKEIKYFIPGQEPEGFKLGRSIRNG